MNYLYFVLVFMGVSYALELWLDIRQRKLLKLKEMPKDVLERHKELREQVDAEKFEKSQSYGRAKNLFSMIVNTIEIVQNFAFLFYGFYPFSWEQSGRWLTSAPASDEEEPKAPSEYLQSYVFLGFTSLFFYRRHHVIQ